MAQGTGLLSLVLKARCSPAAASPASPTFGCSPHSSGPGTAVVARALPRLLCATAVPCRCALERWRAQPCASAYLHQPPPPTPLLPPLHRLHPETKPAAALLGRGLLGRGLKDYPGSDNFFPLEQNSSHRKQSSSAWETTAWGWPNLEQGRN